MQKELPFMGPKDKSKICNTNLVEFIEFGNKIELAEIIVVCAISRSESRGAHYRADIPDTKRCYVWSTHNYMERRRSIMRGFYGVESAMSMTGDDKAVGRGNS